MGVKTLSSHARRTQVVSETRKGHLACSVTDALCFHVKYGRLDFTKKN